MQRGVGKEELTPDTASMERLVTLRASEGGGRVLCDGQSTVGASRLFIKDGHNEDEMVWVFVPEQLLLHRAPANGHAVPRSSRLRSDFDGCAAHVVRHLDVAVFLFSVLLCFCGAVSAFFCAFNALFHSLNALFHSLYTLLYAFDTFNPLTHTL